MLNLFTRTYSNLSVPTMQVLVLVLVGYKKGNYLAENYSTFLLISLSCSSVPAMAGVQSSRSRSTTNKGAATKAAEKRERARRLTEASKDLPRAGEGSQERPSRGGEHAELAVLESLSLDDMPAELNKQEKLTVGLVKLLKESIASGKKATGEILQLQEDKAKLRHELDLLKEENAGWKKLHEKRISSVKMLNALVMEQKEELAKLRIEHPAAVKLRNAAVEEMMNARVDKSRVMDRMKKMAEERREEMKVVEAMKKQLEQV